ncbi:aromatic-ring-hydroxylating dioxygenase subunit beta [Azospirillum sp. ST 5-10]|uniref:aromatic-ring-hydroxylating dioxygenase subunit beta n=1 Tax=unclassified Azospirillum TaxID=2630922 RepID=UPI003F4A77FD
MTDLHREIEAFLYAEARLLDEGRNEEWLALFTDDALYWVPAGRGEIDPTRHVSIIHDDRTALARRVKRLASGQAYAQDPASRTHRLVSNVAVERVGADGAEVEVTCVMLLAELARHRQTLYPARCDFTLRRRDGGWAIARKRVNLLASDEPLEALGFLV